MSWTQPICTACWIEENSVPDDDGGALIRTPIRVRNDGDGEAFMEALQKCCKCGRATTSGIFIRVDPTTVPYPSNQED